MKKEEVKYRIIVSTNTFATNFDKELCAFVTGQIGEFELYFKERPTDEKIKALVEGFHEFADEKKEKNPITERITLHGIKVIKKRSLYEESEESYELPVIMNAIN
jgi:hypothetical protein